MLRMITASNPHITRGHGKRHLNNKISTICITLNKRKQPNSQLPEGFLFNWHQLHHPAMGGNWSTNRGFPCILGNSCLQNLNISFDLPAPDLGDL